MFPRVAQAQALNIRRLQALSTPELHVAAQDHFPPGPGFSADLDALCPAHVTFKVHPYGTGSVPMCVVYS